MKQTSSIIDKEFDMDMCTVKRVVYHEIPDVCATTYIMVVFDNAGEIISAIPLTKRERVMVINARDDYRIYNPSA